MTREQASKTAKAAIGIPTAVLVVIFVARWAIETFSAQNYVTRAEWSQEREARARFDSATAQTLRRIDSRVAEMYCGRVPAQLRPGCQ